MLKTKKPSAIIYGLEEKGTLTLMSDVYFEEDLQEEVIVYSLPYTNNIEQDFAQFTPDLIIYLDNSGVILNNEYLISKTRTYPTVFPPLNILANDIVCQSTFITCKNISPFFSIFTPTYKTGERIKRTYESIKNQTYGNWEWVILDDSPDDETWNIINDLAKQDYRIKPFKLNPITGGNVGLAKNRAASLCEGDWLVELDHDDALISTCLEDCYKASIKYPDAGFIYTDVCELYENGEMKSYGHIGEDWYANPSNPFDFGYAGHTWVEADGKSYLNHHYPEINPLTIRFNISMPNHARMWKAEVYKTIKGHNKNLPVADDYELIVRTFLNTRILHVQKMLYLQYNNGNSTVDNNSKDINRRARLIRDYYDPQIHDRILELGKIDWNWDEKLSHSQQYQNQTNIRKYYKEEEVLNYIITEN